MKVLKIEPGKAPITINIENSLESLQGQVGGYIETVTIATDTVIICDEEGKLKGKPYNFRLCGMDFVGIVLIAGCDEDEFCDLSQENNEWFCEQWCRLRWGDGR